jgi:hypothetical protein
MGVVTSHAGACSGNNMMVPRDLQLLSTAGLFLFSLSCVTQHH